MPNQSQSEASKRGNEQNEEDAVGRNCHDPRCVRVGEHCIGDVGCSGRFTAQGYTACWSPRCKLQPVHPMGYPGCITLDGAGHFSGTGKAVFTSIQKERPKEEERDLLKAYSLGVNELAEAHVQLKAAVREYLDAEESRTGGSHNLQVRGAARMQMLAKEARRTHDARAVLKKLVGR